MNNIDLLNMIDQGKIEEVRQYLKDEIYKSGLKTKTGSRTRYNAMKRYFKYRKSSSEYLNKPCKGIVFEGETYNSFTNSWSLVFTKEDIGEIEPFNLTEINRYPDVAKLMKMGDELGTLNVSKVISEAKVNGYKLSAKEVDHRSDYLMYIDRSYYKIGLLHSSFAIIDDGELPTIYKNKSVGDSITLKTSIGYCLILSVKYEKELGDGKTIIKIDDFNEHINPKHIVGYYRTNGRTL